MIRAFGKLSDGRGIDAITLGAPDGLQVDVLTYGAILRKLTYPVRGVRRDLILHFDDLAAYEADRAYVGPLVGRFGNRIAASRFMLDGHAQNVSANEGANHLHGGHLGFGKRVWRILEAPDDDSRVTLGLTSPDGEEGYPGEVEVSAQFEISRHSLKITLLATTTEATPINLTYHPYFNLAGPNVPATLQRLRIPASRYLPVKAGLIPTGEMTSVTGTTFDFRESRNLAPPPSAVHPQLALGGGYDHCWVLDADADCACELTSPTGDVALKMLGSGPGLQFYNGQYLAKTHPTLGSGVILEPQGLPDAPNQPNFPNSILRPGDTYRATIEYALHAAAAIA